MTQKTQTPTQATPPELRTSKEICADLRRYNKDKGWPLAHEAADMIEALEKKYNELFREFHKTRLL